MLFLILIVIEIFAASIGTAILLHIKATGLVAKIGGVVAAALAGVGYMVFIFRSGADSPIEFVLALVFGIPILLAITICWIISTLIWAHMIRE